MSGTFDWGKVQALWHAQFTQGHHAKNLHIRSVKKGKCHHHYSVGFTSVINTQSHGFFINIFRPCIHSPKGKIFITCTVQS